MLIKDMKTSRMDTKIRIKGIAERSTFVALCFSVVNEVITGLATNPRINVTAIAMKRPTGRRRRLFVIITPISSKNNGARQELPRPCTLKPSI
jgi:hypothetical protein